MARPTAQVDVDDELDAVVDALLSGPYRAVPVLDDGTCVGLATERSVLTGDTVDGLEGTVQGVANTPITTTLDATVGKIRSVMRGEDIGRLPVVDDDGNLAGIVEWASLLKLTRPKDRPGPRDRRGTSTLQDDKLTVETVMDTVPLTVGTETPLSQATRKMLDADRSYAVIVDEGRPVGVFTCRDLLELLAARAPTEGVYIQISGAQDLDDDVQADLMSRVEAGLQKVARVYGGQQTFYLHVKTYQEGGSQTKYSLRCRFMTPVGPYHAKGHGYALMDTVDEVMDRLERRLKEEVERHRDRRRQPYNFDEEAED